MVCASSLRDADEGGFGFEADDMTKPSFNLTERKGAEMLLKPEESKLSWRRRMREEEEGGGRRRKEEEGGGRRREEQQPAAAAAAAAAAAGCCAHAMIIGTSSSTSSTSTVSVVELRSIAYTGTCFSHGCHAAALHHQPVIIPVTKSTTCWYL
jgi:hypothetical protein